MGEEAGSRIGFYGEFPESWGLMEEQRRALLKLEQAIGADSSPLPSMVVDDDA